jgi:hypothetical protein
MKQGNHLHNIEESYREITGWMIQAVHYTEVDLYPASPRPYFRTDNPRLHTVDMALSFFASPGGWFTFLWREETPVQYGVHLELGERKKADGQRTWNVSEEPFWRATLGHRISGVEVIGVPLDTGSRQEGRQHSATCVQTVVLHFSNGKAVFVSAAELPLSGQGKAILGTNNLLVADDETLAKQCNLINTNFCRV